MINLTSFLEDLADRTQRTLTEDLKKRPKESQACSIEEFTKKCVFLKAQLDRYNKTGKYTSFKTLDQNGNEPEESENDTPEQPPQRSRRGRPPTVKPLADVTASVDLFNVKKEKISLAAVPEDVEKTQMPAPTKPAPRKRIKAEPKDDSMMSTTRTTRTKTRMNATTKEEQKRDSDIVIQNPVIPVVDLLNSSDEEVASKPVQKEAEGRSTRTKTRKAKQADEKSDTESNSAAETTVTRSTRTKTKAKAQQNASKRIRDANEDTHDRDMKKSRSHSPLKRGNDVNETKNSEYEDAVSTLVSPNNATFVTSPKGGNVTYVTQPNKDGNATYVTQPQQDNANATMVVHKPKVAQNDPLMTDDESEDEILPKNGKTKQLFNPFEVSPVKKKVQAFEKLGKSAALPTRTIKPAAKQDVEAGTVKEKSKVYTPTAASKILPKVCSTSKLQRTISGLGTESSVLGKSALKASQEQYRERERRQREEALKKREALLKAQAEEKRKKREERQTKAQQQREQIEKERARIVEQQKAKEERTKQLMAEKEEKQAKLREEMERKRLQAKEKAAAVKQLKEEEIKLREKQNQQAPKVPIYMSTEPPLLPTDDCYDSDDERADGRRFRPPSWCSDSNLKEQELMQIMAGEKLKNTFYCRQAMTPDLRDIFESIDVRKLKRTSSAHWRKPPRYTLMPAVDQPSFVEDEEDDQDEED